MVYLQSLEKIYIQIAEDDNLLFLKFQSDNDLSERDIPLLFFEKVDNRLLSVIFEDLFGNNIKKKRCLNELQLILNKTDAKSKKEKDIFLNIYNCIKEMLSKTYIVDDAQIKTSDDGMI